MGTTYCPCCPKCCCDCNCDCNCRCECTKKRMMIPTFIFSFLCLILILLGMTTKSTDTSNYKNFKIDYNIDNNSNYNKILDIEKNEDKYSLILLIIGIIIWVFYLVLSICFFYEKTWFKDYDPKCKVPYYFVMMLINFVLNYVNAIIAFVFCGYRSDTINDYSDFFGDTFKNYNDMNMGFEIVIGLFYIVCSILHLYVYYYLFKEDRICFCCCQSFIDCISCCKGCLKCLFCCCCCIDCIDIQPSVEQKPPVQQEVVIIQQNPQDFNNNNIVYNNNNNVYNNNAYNNNNNGGLLNQIRNLLPGSVKGKVDRVCNKSIYNNSFAQFVNCIICGSMFQIGQEILIFPCGHICHSNCGYNWFQNHKNCPSDGLIIIN